MKKIWHLFLCLLFCTAFLSVPEKSVGTPQLQYPVSLIQEKVGYPVYLCPTLIPSLFIDKEIPYEDYKTLIDRIVSDDAGNTLRGFAFGVWERSTMKLVRFPWKRMKSGKFNLNKIDPAWLSETVQRIEYFAERGGTVIYTLIDGCSLHNRPNSHWALHPWNGRNNINGTNHDPRTLWHIWDWNDGETRATRHYVLKFINMMIAILEERFPGKIVYDFNELDITFAGYGMWDRVYQAHHIPRNRKMFSFIEPEDEGYLVAEFWMWQLHGINNLQSYYDKVGHPLGLHYSADGYTANNTRQITELVYTICRHGNLGFELNLQSTNSTYVIDLVDWKRAEQMMKGFRQWWNSLD